MQKNTSAISPQAPTIEQEPKAYKYFDPKSPELPSEVLGVDVQSLLDLNDVLNTSGNGIRLGHYALPNAVKIMPLIEDLQANKRISPEDVTLYRGSIKKLSFGASAADKLAIGTSALGVGIPLRRALNRKVERDFPERAAKSIAEARETVARNEAKISHIASFENPNEQLKNEIDDLSRSVRVAILEAQQHRLTGNQSMQDPRHETPRGLAGILTKIARGVRRFFGLFSRNKRSAEPSRVNPAVTAYDAGAGIRQTIDTLLQDMGQTAIRFPLTTKLIMDKIPTSINAGKDRLALVAPEILTFLFSTSPQSQENNQLLADVRNNPHELRFVTSFKKHFGRYDIRGVQHTAKSLLPAILNVLPTSGEKVWEAYDKLRLLLENVQNLDSSNNLQEIDKPSEEGSDDPEDKEQQEIENRETTKKARNSYLKSLYMLLKLSSKKKQSGEKPQKKSFKTKMLSRLKKSLKKLGTRV
jgi:hypothetical protein